MKIKSIYKHLKTLVKSGTAKRFNNSHQYWIDRYHDNGNSGSGSYGRLAVFKANILNEFVNEHDIRHVVELGCGDGNQLTHAIYPKYTGYDISDKAIEICKHKFLGDSTKNFFLLNANSTLNEVVEGDLLLSLDVIFHLIEDSTFVNYIKLLFESSNNYVIIYSSNENREMVSHVKSREFTSWIEEHIDSNWILTNKIDNIYPYDSTDINNTSIANFYIYKLVK